MKREEFLFGLKNPQVYTGKEINCSRKEWNEESINICLVFPDIYEIGMSHDGIKILYHLLNKLDGINTERCFMPEKDSITAFKETNTPLFSLENKIPLKQFDLIGFSLLSELNSTNVLAILDLAQIPLKTCDRKKNHPLIAAGGISIINPEPLRDFFDLFAVGDGEQIFPHLVNLLSQIKKKNLTRNDKLRQFDQIDGIYVPALYPLYQQGPFLLPKIHAKKIKKQVISNLNQTPGDSRVIVPITNVVFNRLSVEIARGCLQNCRFCQAKTYYSPYREKIPEQNLQFIQEALAKTGFESFSLSSLSSGDYSRLSDLLTGIPGMIPPCTDFSVPSLRPATLTPSLLQTLSKFRRTGITIVPEAGSGRLRKVINKKVTDEEIFKAVDVAIQNQWQRIKLYFMMGLPTETKLDIEAIVQLIEAIVQRTREKKHRIKIHTSFSTFVPKPHTALQWARRESLDTIYEKIHFLKSRLKKYKHLDLDFHKPEKGVVETILARGDKRVGELILQAYAQGEVNSAWDADFNYAVWSQLIKNYHTFLGEIPLDQPLPWDHIQVNFKKEYLIKEYKKAHLMKPSTSCSPQKCPGCQGCYFHCYPDPGEKSTRVNRDQAPMPKETQYHRIRLFYSKKGHFRFFSHLSMMKYVERIIRQTKIPFKCTSGFHPRIKMASLPPLPVFALGEMEVIEIFLDNTIKEAEILKRLNTISKDLQFKYVKNCTHTPSLMKDIFKITYTIALKPSPIQLEKINGILYPNDIFSVQKGTISLTIDYRENGQQRFANIYKILDPERKQTRYLIRQKVYFFSDQ